MEHCWLHENAAADSNHMIAVVGLGNPFHGDDAAGCVVARDVFEQLSLTQEADLLEPSATGFRLSEHLIGYHRAVIIDTLIDPEAPIGTVKSVEILGGPCGPPVSLHASGFHEGLALARDAGLLVPSHIGMYGIVIREPSSFSETLSVELVARLPEIVSSIIAAEALPGV
jgi:hydrogenase maturation protease